MAGCDVAGCGVALCDGVRWVRLFGSVRWTCWVGRVEGWSETRLSYH